MNATHPETNAWAQFESNQVSLDEFDDLFRAESEAKGHAIGGKQVIELLSGAHLLRHGPPATSS